MAELTKDFTNDQSRYEQVLAQRGRKVIDGELNEIGRLVRVQHKRWGLLNDNASGHAAGDYGYARGQGIIIEGGPGATQITIKPNASGRGLISFRGYTFEITSDQVISGLTTGPLGADEYQQVYMELDEIEVDGGADPSIVVAQLGETAIRTQLRVVFKIGAVDTDEAGPINTLAEPYESGGKKTAVLAYVKRLSGASGAPAAHEIFSRMVSTRDFQEFQDRNIILSTTAPALPAYVTFDGTSTLTFSNVGILVPGMWDTATPSPIDLKLPATVSMPSIGDALVLKIPRGVGMIGHPSTANVLTFDVVNFEPNKVEMDVENFADWDEHYAETNEDGFADRYVLCVRVGASRFRFRNGNILQAPGLPANNPGQGRMYIGYHSSTELHQDGDPAAATDAEDETPVLRTRYSPQSAGLKLLWEARLDADIWARLYSINVLHLNSGFVLTVNARWDPSSDVWEADDTVPSSSGFYLTKSTSVSNTIFGVAGRAPGGAATWANNSWPASSSNYSTFMDGLGSINGQDLSQSFIRSFRYLELTGTTDPAVGAGTSDGRLYKTNMPVAWGRIQSGASPTLLDAFGIASAADAGVGGDIDVTLNQTMANTNYCVIISGQDSGLIWNVNIQSTTVFRVAAVDHAGVNVDLVGGGTEVFNVLVFGR